MTSEAVQAGVGTAHLSPELTDDDKYTIHGVALGAGDVTVGSSGIKKKWPATELNEAASTLEGQPLVRDHENNTDGTVGKVTKAHYRDGVGVVYEAELASHYEELAQDIKSGLLEVSARAYHAPVEELEEDDDTGALVVENIRFDNLSIVSQGASPSNSVKMGEATAMAQGPDGEAVATLEQGSPRPDPAELATHEFDEGDWVKGQSSGGTWHGKIRDMKMDGCFSDRIDGDFEICANDDEPVYLIENYDPESGEFTDTMVAHLEGSIEPWDHEENHRAAQAQAMTAELEASMDELDEVYNEWQSHVNMTASELEQWAENPCSEEASVNPDAVIDRNMNLLETDKEDWTTDEIEDAKRTISFISRMSAAENKPDEPKDGPHGCPSEWAISLLNWAYNPFDSVPAVPEQMKEENQDNTHEFTVGDLVEWSDGPDVGLGFGTISAVDGDQYTVVPVGRDNDGSFTDLNSEKFTINGSKLTLRQSFDESSSGYSGVPEELASFGLHAPEFDGTTKEVSGDGRVTMSDFKTDDLGEIAEHFLLSGSGYPPDKFGDLKLPVVTPDGDLSLPKLRAAKRAVGSVDGLDADLAIDVVMMINRHIMSEFPDEPLAADLEQHESGDVAELEAAWHTPNWDGLDDEREWERPSLSDFMDAYGWADEYDSWDSLPEDAKSQVTQHFFVSKTGAWPPEDYGDLALPVVWPNGDLSLDGLDSAHQVAKNTDGVSDEMGEKLQAKMNKLAQKHFDQPISGEEMSSDPDLWVATLTDDDPERASTDSVAAFTLPTDD